MPEPVKHICLGLGAGRIVTFDDGTVAFFASRSQRESFRVAAFDIEGISVERVGIGQRRLKFLGHHQALAEVVLSETAAERLQAWFSSQQSLDLVSVSPKSAPASPGHELARLIQLRDEGVISEAEFIYQRSMVRA